MEVFNIMSANKNKKRVYDWDAIEQAAGEKIGVIYGRLGSTRDLGDYLGQFTKEKMSISYCTIQSMLKARNVPSLGRGGRNNGKHNYVKLKSGNICPKCGKDPYPNRFICRTCNSSEDWTESYGFSL